MEKPSDYENAQTVTDYEVLEPGAYKCKILKAEELKASNDKTYLKVSFDIVEGPRKDFYENKYQLDTRQDKKWGGTLVVFVLDYEGNTNRYFKTLITCAEESNTNYKFDWNKPEELKDKKIGIIFREEEFQDMFGNIKTATKPFRACTYNKTKEAKIPSPKKLKQSGEAYEGDGVIPSDNDDLPF